MARDGDRRPSLREELGPGAHPAGSAANRAAGLLHFDVHQGRETLVSALRLRAAAGTSAGTREDLHYRMRCRAVWKATGALLLYTRDTGYISGVAPDAPGQLACRHLSISYLDLARGARAPFNPRDARDWIRRFYPDREEDLWYERPQTREGGRLDLHHWRLFCTGADFETLDPELLEPAALEREGLEPWPAVRQRLREGRRDDG